MSREYDYSVWSTQGGGLVRWVNGTYIFVEKPDCPGLDVGDEMPEEWGVIPANDSARQDMEEADEFNRGLQEFFDMAFDKVDQGKMTLDDVERFFPSEVRDRYS